MLSTMRRLLNRLVCAPRTARRTSARRARRATICLEMLEDRLCPAAIGVDVWTGAGAAANLAHSNPDWSNGQNWQSLSAPNAGDILEFPSSSSTVKSKISVNDYAAGRGYDAITISGSDYTLSGNDVVLQSGGLTNSGANNVFSLPLTLAAAQTIAVTSGDLTMLAPAYIDNGGHDLTVDAAGTFYFKGLDLTGSGGLIVNGGARCVLANTMNNTYGGGTAVVNPTPTPSNQAVTLYLDASGGAVAIPGSIAIGDSTGFDQAYVVRLLASNQIANTAAVTVKASGLLDLNGNNNTIGPLTMTGGAVTTGDNSANHGTLTLTDSVQVAATATAVIDGYLSLGAGSAAQTFQVASAAGGPNLALNVTAIVSGGPNVALVKSGAGIMQLSADNTYQGPTLVSGGTLVVASTGALGASSATTVQANGVLRYTNPNGSGPYAFAAEPITLTGGTLQGSGSGSLQVPGQIALQGLSNTLAADANTVLALTGVVTGSGSFTKLWQGEVDLYGADNYTGSTTVTTGVLGIYNKSALSTAGVKVSAQATLMLANNVSCLPDALTLAGTLSGNGTWSGAVNLTGNADINAAKTGALTVSGLIDGPAPDSLTIGDATNYPGATSTVLLTAANTYAGPTVVGAGTLAITSNNALGVPSGNKTNSGTTVDSGATLELLGGLTVPMSESLTLGSGSSGTGMLLNGTGDNTWSGPVLMATDSTFGANAGALTVNGIISDPGPTNPSNLSKVGTGTLVLAGSNTYYGRTFLEAGTVTLANASALGNAPLNTGEGTIIDSGATLQLQGGLGVPYNIEPLNVQGGTIEALPGASKWSGPIKLQGPAPATIMIDSGATFTDNIQVTNEGTPLTIDTLGSAQFNVMSGTGTLTKVGPGTLTFSGLSPEDVIGAVTVNAGTLALVSHASLTAPITINAASLTLDNTSAITGPVNINNGGTVVDDGTITGSVVVGMAGPAGPAGILEGTGTILGYVNNGGVVSPGDPGGIGTLTIDGPYTQTGTLDIVIGSSGYDVLAIKSPSGGMASASLGGTLNVTLEPGVKLKSGESFVIMTFPAFGGKFQTTNLPPGMTIVYNPTNVTLVQD